jgi:hypothetical protein
MFADWWVCKTLDARLITLETREQEAEARVPSAETFTDEHLVRGNAGKFKRPPLEIARANEL